MERRDKFYGCLLGGAAGDALGYAVEFMQEAAIQKKYGKDGITDYALRNGSAVVSDDTQMTFFTANGLLLADASAAAHDACISLAYREWLLTQTKSYTPEPDGSCWLLREERLFQLRAPGNTCLTYCETGAKGSVEHPENHSCGCGGVMRVAPIGLYFDSSVHAQDWIDMRGAQAAAMTHGHPMGYIPAAALVHLISRVTYGELSLREAAEDTASAMDLLFRGTAGCRTFTSMMRDAMAMSEADTPALDCIHALGEGWTGHEAFGIALYCALKYENDFDMAIRTAVNHRGDSDSTGAIAGNILGAYLGLSSIPEKYLTALEMTDIARTLAEDLWLASRGKLTGERMEKYRIC